MCLYLPVYGVLVVDFLKKMAMTTEKNSVIGGKINGRPSNSLIKELYLIILLTLKIRNSKNGTRCKLRTLKKKLILVRVSPTILCQL
jgi:hypothetical protein